MRWASGAKHGVSILEAAEEAIEEVRESLGAPPDLVLAYVNPGVSDSIGGRLEAAFPQAIVVGASAGGVIASGVEMETGPALSITAAQLDGCTVHTLAFGQDLLPSLEARHLRAGLAGGDESEPKLIITLVDPKSGEPRSLLEQLDIAFPQATIVGGLASGDQRSSALLVDGRASAAAAVLVAVRGAISVTSMISQGCRPIGDAMLITRSQGNLIYELGQKKPVPVMQALHESLSESDKRLFQSSLFLGIEMQDQLEYKLGDFLVRNVLGIEPTSGALAVGAMVEQFKAVQFHLRDAASAREELDRLLEQHKAAGEAEAVLLFSCLGRGFGLFQQDHYESARIRRALGQPVLGGFFCGGEIGPVAGKTFLHGYTSAAAILRSIQ